MHEPEAHSERPREPDSFVRLGLQRLSAAFLDVCGLQGLHRLVPVPLWLAPKLALYLAMRDQRVNNSELARRLGVHERVVRRMLDPQHATKAEKIQAALAVLGKQMTVEVRDVA